MRTLHRFSRRSLLGRTRRDRRGAAAAEFALTLPIYILLLLGTLEYGNFLTQLAMVYQVTGDAARYGSQQATLGEATTESANAARQLMSDLGFDCDVGSGGCTVSSRIIQEGGIDYVEVSVDKNYDQLTNAIPVGKHGWSVALPTVLRARAVYPITGT
ncbi:MAG: pilus assembly protein [Alphaproteobacteria bacterium]|nr:pilus assembly protein [Alphaproteobacteria bacterium]